VKLKQPRHGLGLKRAAKLSGNVWPNSHQNSHSPKIKMAANLAASHLADFIGFFAPQVGLESTIKRTFNNMQVSG
jgi:hypothetical protein